MKKISAVLLVLVLVGSVAFAGFTGSASVDFTGDFDSGKFGFTNDKLVTVDLVLAEALGEKTGSGDVYASIAASFTFGFDVEDVGPGAVGDPGVEVDFDHATIGNEDWYVSILGAMGAPDFAASAIDFDSDDEGLNLAYDFKTATPLAGVEVGVAGFKVGLAVPFGNNNQIVKDDNKHNVLATLVTPDFKLVDGLTLTAGAAARLSNVANQAISGSLKTAFEADEFSVTVASDLFYDLTSEDFEAEVAANAVYDFLTLDAYFATLEMGENPPLPYGGATNVLSVQAKAEIEQFDVTVFGKDLVNTQDLGASVKFQATDELAVTARGGYVIATEVWNAGADVEYKVDALTAKAGATFYKDSILEAYASVETTTLVDGATLSLAWKDAKDLLDKGTPATKYGKVVAAAKIAF